MQGFCISARNEGKIGAVHAAMWKGREVGVEDCEEGGGTATGRGKQGVRAKYGESVFKNLPRFKARTPG